MLRWSLISTVTIALAAAILPGQALAGPVDAGPDASYIVRFDPGVDPQAAARQLSSQGIEVDATYEHVFAGVAVTANAAEVADLRSDLQVASIEADLVMHAVDDVVGADDVQTPAPWGLDRIDQRALPLSNTFEAPATGAGVKVYVLDSGIRTDHTEFTGRLGTGMFFNGTSVEDCNGHGTHVSGIVGGSTYGVAKAVKIVPVRVLDCNGEAYTSTVVQGINWIVNNHQAGQPAVLNASIGGVASSMVDTAFQSAVDDGITVVIAAGNGDTNHTPIDACTQSPARLPAAITVGATTVTDATASFSNYGTCVDLLAPGVSITSAWDTSSTATAALSGTSMASPHVAGAAALLLQRTPTLTPAQVASQLITDATVGAISNPGTGTPNRLLYLPPATTPVPPPPPPPPPTFVPLVPARLLETRGGLSTVDGRFNGVGAIAPGGVLALPVGGRGGVATDASAVALNVTVAGPAAAGFVTAFPCGSDIPNSSSVNFGPGTTVANAVVSKVGTDGQVCLFSNVSANLVVDVNGYFPLGSTYVPVVPGRFLETRSGLPTIDGAFAGQGELAAGAIVPLTVAGRGAVAVDAAAVVANVTVADPDAAGFVTVFPCGTSIPNSSSLNFVAHATVANAVIAKVGSGGGICLYTNVATQLVVDVTGWFPAGAGFDSLAPARLLDTRSGMATVDGLFAGQGQIAAGSVLALTVAGRGNVGFDAGAVVLNVTVVGSSAAGFVTVFPCGGGVPNSSSVNFGAGTTVANAVVTQVGAGGQVCFYTNVATHLLADVNGYFPTD